MDIFGDKTEYEKYFDKAGSYLEKGNLEKAIEYLDKALEINPNYIDALVNQGFALQNLGIFNEALDCYDKILAIDPNQAVALLNKGIILLDKLKDYEKAINCYDILLNMDKRVFKDVIKEYNINYPHIYANIYNDKGLALFNLKRYKDAIYYYNESLKIDPENLKALHGKKLAEDELNDIKNNSHPNYNTQINDGMDFCPKCGTKSVTGAEFCYNCGAKLIQDNAVGDINTSINGSGNENFNYQNIEKSVVRMNEPKKFKHPLISIFDAINNIFLVLLFVSTVILILSYIIPLSEIIRYGSGIFVIIFLAIAVGSSTISNMLKRRLRQKITQTGIPAQARVLKVTNLEYSHHQGIRTAKLTLEVYPETDTPYQVKSTVNVGVSDASLIFRPGSTVKVFIDPEDASQVEVEY